MSFMILSGFFPFHNTGAISTKSYDYVIDDYNVNVVVNENNTLDITETINAYFNIPKHGIFRTIPLENSISRLDGTMSRNSAKISNLSVNNTYSASKENGNYKIQIGSPDQTVTKVQTYVIKYTYDLGRDPLKDRDELYYNIIGPEWDTEIRNVTFDITMPKDFDATKVGFSAGAFGSVDSENITYHTSGNKISGSYDGILQPGEALTIRIELPEGYFVRADFLPNWAKFLVLVLPLLFLAISIWWWYKFGKDEPVVATVEFYPPGGFNSLEIGFLYKGKAGNQDVTSLLIYLANKGYVKITETEEKNVFTKSKGFKITKLKDYDGHDSNERLFLEGLFKRSSSKTAGGMEEVTSSDLYNKFYITMNKILAHVNSKKNKNKIFENSTLRKVIFYSIILMIAVTFCLITIPPVLEYGEPEDLIVVLLFCGIGFPSMFAMLIGGTQTVYVNGRATTSNVITKIFAIVWGLMFAGVPWAVWLLPMLMQNPFYLVAYIVGLACVLGMVACLKFLPKRTPYGNEMLGKIRGFRNFLETTEKEKLEAMVAQDPSYFYNILPYTYVLGVSDKWIKKFEDIALQAPDWYDNPAGFNVVMLGAFMNNTMSSVETAMASSPSSSSGGGSSGGGFSGGGSGGGGGGSW